MKELKGIIVAVVTPFTDSGTIALDLLKDHLEFLLAAGVHGLALCSSAGEYEALSSHELEQVFSTASRTVDGRLPIIGRIGGCSTQEAIRLAKIAEASGLDALLMPPPNYLGYTFNEEEIFHYFADVAASTPLSIMLYNTNKARLNPPFVAQLAQIPTIRYLKDSTADLRNIHELIEIGKGHMSIINGWDSVILEALLIGVQGIFSALANIIPHELVYLYQLVLKEDYKQAIERYRRIYPLLALLEDKSRFVAWIKVGIHLCKRDAGLPRRPYLPANKAEIAQIKEAMLLAGIDLP